MDDTHSLAPDDARYPRRLASLPSRPLLRVRGVLHDERPHVAIVGTRAASIEAATFAEELGESLARRGVVVVSGGARGIDAAAHIGALAGEGSTVVVLGTGIDVTYPPEHAPLFARIVERGGALVSAVPDGSPPVPHAFVARNTWIAALADHVVVVEAPARSGALATARVARRLGRALSVVPAHPSSARAEGSNALLRDVSVRVCLDEHDVLTALGIASPRRRTRTRRTSRPVRIEDYAAARKLSVSDAMAELAKRELDGEVTVRDGWVAIANGTPLDG